MGDITQALRTAQSGLLVNQQALNSVSNNVANVNTVGYSKKVINTEAIVVAGTGAGVKISEISRRVDEGLLKSIRIENGELNTLTVQEDFYARLQDLFGKPADNNSIAHLMEEFAEAMELLSLAPNNSLEQAELVRRAQDVTSKLSDMSATIQELRLQADNEVTDIVAEINKITALIDQLNDDIISNSSVSRDVTDLRDQRDLEIDKLSKLIDIRFFFRNDGDVVVFTSGGRTLVDTIPPVLTHNGSSTISSTSTAAEGDIAGIFVGNPIAANDITNEVREGQLKGLIDLRDGVLTDLQSQLDEMAADMRDTFNQIHNRSVPFPGLQTMTGTRTFVAPTTQTIKLDNTSGADDVTIALFDSNGDQSAVTTLETILVSATFGTGAQVANAAVTITEVAATIEDWLQANGAAGATAAINSTGKLAISLNTTSVNLAFRDETATATGSTAADAAIGFDSNGDGNIDETVNGFSNFFGLNDFFQDNLADNIHESDVLDSTLTASAATLTFRDATGALAGSPLAVAAGTTLTALATLITNSVTNVTAAVVPDGAGVRLRISHDQGSSMTITQAAAETFLTDIDMHVADVRTAESLFVRTDIADAPSNVSTGLAQFNAVLGASGEYFMSVADDTTIQQLTAAFTSNHVFDKAGGLGSINVSFTQYAAGIVSNNASLANINERDIKSQQSLTEALQFKSDSLRGVNLDEEMADLIVFEQAFGAAARVITVIQDMIKALERAIG